MYNFHTGEFKMKPDLFGVKIPSTSLDLSATLGYGLIYQPIIAHVDPSIHPLIIRPRHNSLRRFYYRKPRK